MYPGSDASPGSDSYPGSGVYPGSDAYPGSGVSTDCAGATYTTGSCTKMPTE